MSRLVLLVEELSMKVFLDGLLPRIFPELRFLCVPHEGKSDLEASLARKLRAWNEPGVRFVVIRDNDGSGCLDLKARLAGICSATGRAGVTIRIACQELEAWYLGDPQALALAYRDVKLRRLDARARFRNPDSVVNPAQTLERLIPEFQKVTGARQLAEVMDAGRNRSRSFQVFIEAVRAHAAAIGAEPRERGSD